VSTDRVGGRTTSAGINVVEPNYFDLMRVPLVRGHDFPAHEQGAIAGPESRPLRSIIVNETMARQRWPGQDPGGKIVWLGCREDAPRTTGQVIAVARDYKYRSLDQEPQPLLYISRLQVWWNGFFALIVHTTGDPGSLAEPLIRIARAKGPNLRIYE